jgi:hypothetical protein
VALEVVINPKLATYSIETRDGSQYLIEPSLLLSVALAAVQRPPAAARRRGLTTDDGRAVYFILSGPEDALWQ